jgi:3-mercaptopyruvate sulfurtransferase SseA
MSQAEKLIALGSTNVQAFEGGLDAWKAAGRTLEVPREADRDGAQQEVCSC